MLGLMFIVGIGSLVLLVALAMWAAKRISLKAGQSAATAQRWKYGVLAAVLLAIFWDWLPTWIASEYYSRQSGLTVFKTLEQWKAEHPGVAGTLEAYQLNSKADKRAALVYLPNDVFRDPLNARFAMDWWKETPILSIRVWRRQLIDTQTNIVLASETSVTSGNPGGIASGGAGWAKPWLIRERTPEMQDASNAFLKVVDSAHQIAERK